MTPPSGTVQHSQVKYGVLSVCGHATITRDYVRDYVLYYMAGKRRVIIETQSNYTNTQNALLLLFQLGRCIRSKL